ncbi:MAG: ABC transporter permease [Candidatus Eisenbacteria bacterium]
MLKILKVARREYLAAVRTRAFIIGLLIMPIFMGGSAIVMLLTQNRVDTTDKKIAVIDRSGVVAEALAKAAEERNKTEVYDKASGKKIKPAYIVEAIEPDEGNLDRQRLMLSDRVRSRDLHAFLDVGPDVLKPGQDSTSARIAYHAENAVVDDVRGWMISPLNNHLRNLRMAKYGIDQDAVKDMMIWLPVEGLDLVSVDAETGQIKEAKRSSEARAVAIPFIMQMLMFMMIMMGAVPLLNSVMEEKSQRIAEVLLGSVRPFEFMMGKVLGGVGVSLTASLVYVAGGAISVGKMGLADYIPYHILPWFFAYMVLAILMFGAMLASLGSTCNDARDAQSLMMPAMFPVILPMFVMVPLMREPLSTFSTGLSLFPLFTPMLMMLRMGTPVAIPAWQPWVGAVGVLAFAVLSVWAGSRIFRVGILMQGKSANLGNIVKWAIRG